MAEEASSLPLGRKQPPLTHALRLREAGVVRETPHKLLADGSDWRFLNELKKELKR